MPEHLNKIESACKTCYSYSKPCNYFVRDVAIAAGIQLPSYGSADDLIRTVASQWRNLSAQEAVTAACNGVFVIAGMTSTELHESHGHVAIVLSGQLNGFPRVAATNEGTRRSGKSDGSTPLTRVFPAALVRAGRVRFFGKPAGSTGSW